MTRNRKPTSEAPRLFEAQEREAVRRLRTQRALFIPRFLKEAAASVQLDDAAQENAYQRILHWANLESDGHLAQHRETSIDTQFLDQVFVDGLGYRLPTRSPEAWTLEHKFSVPSVGTADAAIGDFPAGGTPIAVIELKDARTDLDRDRISADFVD